MTTITAAEFRKLRSLESKRRRKRVPLPISGYVDRIELRFPIELPSLNRLFTMHHQTRGRLKREQRETVFYRWREKYQQQSVELPVVVEISRFGQELDGHDNLRGALKAVVDQITLHLGLTNDNDPRVTWLYGQAKGKGEVEIRIRRRPQAWHE